MIRSLGFSHIISRSVGAGLLALVALSLGACDPDPDQSPAFQYAGAAQGCSDLIVYKWNVAGTEALTVRADRAALGLSTIPRTIRLDSITDRSILDVHVDIFAAPQEPAGRYCSDLIVDRRPQPVVWQAIAGTATFTLDTDSVASNMPYKVTVKLDHVRFRHQFSDREAELPSQTFDSVTVGWFPG